MQNANSTNRDYVFYTPSGIFYGKKCVIGNGVVIDPVSLKKEKGTKQFNTDL